MQGKRNSAVAGWMVTVSLFKDDGRFGHVTYAIAIEDAEQAINAALKACAGEAAVINRELSEEQLRYLALNAGDVLALYDETTDPITSRALRH